MSEPHVEPWHDTIMHDCRWGSGRGPVVPVTQERPHEAKAPMHVKCAACGEDWLETDVVRLLRIWWSKGAWDGERKSYPEGVSDGACGHGEERDRVVAWLREWASVGRTDLYEIALEVERGEHWGKTLSKREARALGVPDLSGPQMRGRILELEGLLGAIGAALKRNRFDREEVLAEINNVLPRDGE